MLRERGKGRKREGGGRGERELIKEDRCQALAGKGGGRRAEEEDEEWREAKEGGMGNNMCTGRKRRGGAREEGH